MLLHTLRSKLAGVLIRRGAVKFLKMNKRGDWNFGLAVQQSSHLLFGEVNKSDNLLQVSPRKIKNLISGGPSKSGGTGKFFEKQ